MELIAFHTMTHFLDTVRKTKNTVFTSLSFKVDPTTQHKIGSSLFVYFKDNRRYQAELSDDVGTIPDEKLKATPEGNKIFTAEFQRLRSQEFSVTLQYRGICSTLEKLGQTLVAARVGETVFAIQNSPEVGAECDRLMKDIEAKSIEMKKKQDEAAAKVAAKVNESATEQKPVEGTPKLIVTPQEAAAEQETIKASAKL